MLAAFRRHSALALVTLFFVSGFAAAQIGMPSAPIQDVGGMIPGGSCPHVLDQPVSLREVKLNNPQDLDGDGMTNDQELADRSDPTWSKSYPEGGPKPADHDGDGVVRANDPCDWDPRVPGLKFLVFIRCLVGQGEAEDCKEGDGPTDNDPDTPDKVATEAARLNALSFSVILKDGAGFPAQIDPAPGNQPGRITCHIVFGDDVQRATSAGELPDEETFQPTQVGNSGVYTLTRPLLISDFAGKWTVQCDAKIAGAQKTTPKASVKVNPLVFDMELHVDRSEYFEDEVIHVVAIPEDLRSHIGVGDDAGQGARLHVTAGTAGIPLTPAQGQQMEWDAENEQWTATFDTDRIPDAIPDPDGDGPAPDADSIPDLIESRALDGPWIIMVEASDDAPGEKNTGESVTDVLVNSIPIYQLSLSDPDDTIRGAPISYTSEFLYYDQPADTDGGQPIQVNIRIRRGNDVVFDGPMTKVADGQWRYTRDIRIDDPSGTWAAEASLTHDENLIRSRQVTTRVSPRHDLGVDADTDKASYRGTGVEPNPSSSPRVDGVLGAAQNLPGGADDIDPYAAEIVSAVDRDVVKPIVHVVVKDGERIVVTAVPAGVAGTNYADDGDADGPGTATFRLLFMGTVPSALAHQPDAEQLSIEHKMDWVADGADSHFRGTYYINATDPYGSWVAEVNYVDEADVANTGQGTAAFQILNPNGLGLPPTVDILTIENTAVNGETPVSVDKQAWHITGAYQTRSDPAKPTDVNEVWARIVGGTGSRANQWIRAALEDSNVDGEGKWSVTLHSQTFYGILESDTFEIQAVALTNPLRVDGECIDQLDVCDEFGPNGLFGETAIETLTGSDRFIYSKTDSAFVDFTFPEPVQSTLLGIIAPDGGFIGNGDVLWDGAAHTLRGRIDLNGNQLSEAKIHIRRVAFDNCVEYVSSTRISTNLDLDEEWCLRDRVTNYQNPSDLTEIRNGFDLFNPPPWLPGDGSPADRITRTLSDDGWDFRFLWDIADSYRPSQALKNCGAAADKGTYYVEETTLVRRTNSRHNGTDLDSVTNNAGPMQFPRAGGVVDAKFCHDVPERLDGDATRQPWQNTSSFPARDANIGLPGPPPNIENARYWVWMTTKTTKGFHFNQTVPKTQEDVARSCSSGPNGCLSERANTEDPSPTAITTEGAIPGYSAVQLRFKSEYPTATITAMRRTTSFNDELEFPIGQAGFQIPNRNGAITFVGTIDNNGNVVDPTGFKLRVYKVSLEACAGDGFETFGNDFFTPDNDHEWCVVADETVGIGGFTFPEGYDGQATAGPQPFSVLWQPAGDIAPLAARQAWFATVSVRTADGDRVEFLPPLVDPRVHTRAYTGAPQYPFDIIDRSTKEHMGANSTLFDHDTFNYVQGFEHLCTGAFCHQDLGTTPDLPYVKDEAGNRVPGVLGFGYGGASLYNLGPLFTIDLSGVEAVRDSPNGPRNQTCALQNVAARWSGCGTHDMHGIPFSASIVKDQLFINGTTNDWAIKNDVRTLKVELRMFGYNATTREVGVKHLDTLGVDVNFQTGTVTYRRTNVPKAQTTTGAGTDEIANAVFTRVTEPINGHPYLKEVDWTVRMNLAAFPESLGMSPEYVRRITSEQYGTVAKPAINTRNFLKYELHVNGVSESTFPTNLGAAPLHLDRIDAPASNLLTATMETVDPLTFQPVTTTKTAGELAVVDDNGVRYKLSGNAKLAFETLYGRGIDLGNPAQLLGRLTGVDVAVRFDRAPAEFFLFGPEDTIGFEELGVPGSVTLTLPMALQVCPDEITGQGGGVCDYSGITPGDGTELQSVTVELLPVRVGLDPAFLAVDPDRDPLEWFNVDDKTYGVDLGVNGRIIDQGGRGFHMDGDTDNWTGIRFLNLGASGNLSAEGFKIGQSTLLGFYTTGSGPGEFPSGAANAARWFQMGIDDGCGGYIGEQTATEGERETDVDPQDVGNCVYDPHTPLAPPRDDAGANVACVAVAFAKLQDDVEAGDTESTLADAQALQSCGAAPNTVGFAQCVTTNPHVPPPPAGDDTGPTIRDTQAIRACFEAKDGWGKCLKDPNPAYARQGGQPNGVTSDQNPNCYPLAQTDKSESYAWTFISKQLPIWIRRPSQVSTINNPDPDSKYEPLTDDNEPQETRREFTIPRGYLWNRLDAAPTELVVKNDATGVTFGVDFFDDVFLSLDPTSPNFGLLNRAKRDGNYTVTIRATDNMESWSSVTDPLTRNDAPILQEFTFMLENDRDGDGVSDLREEWLRHRLQQTETILALDPDGDAEMRICDDDDPDDNPLDPDEQEPEGNFFEDVQDDITGVTDPDGGVPGVQDRAVGLVTPPGDKNFYGPCVDGDDRYDGRAHGFDAERGLYWHDATAYPDPLDADSTEEDWDGDGIPNRLVRTLRGQQVPFLGIPLTNPVVLEVNLELILNSDPLVPDLVFEPGDCTAAKPGKGPFGDRNFDPQCRPNILDSPIIERCITDAQGNDDDDRDGDGHCTSAEVQAGSDPSDPDSRPNPVVDPTPSVVEEMLEFLNNVVSSQGICAQPTGETCPHGHFVTVNVGEDDQQEGIDHVYIDADVDARTFSVGFGYDGATPTGCQPAPEPGHCEIVSSTSIVNAVELVRQTINEKVCSSALVAEGLQPSCVHDHDLAITVNQGAITHLYADQGPGIRASVGFGYEGPRPQDCNEVEPGHCQLVGTDSLDDAEEILLGLIGDKACLAPLTPCGGHFATLNPGIPGVAHLYVDAGPGASASVGFHKTPDSTVPCQNPIEGQPDHCEIVGTTSLGNALALIVNTANERLCSTSFVAPLRASCADGHDVTVDVNEGGIGHLYIDHDEAAPSASVGFSYTGNAPPGCQDAGPNHCQVAGTDTFQDALDLVIGAINGRVCSTAFVAPLRNSCAHGHDFTIDVNEQGISHVYADQGPSSYTSVGFGYTGDRPEGCNEVSEGDCEIIGTTTVDGAVDDALEQFADARDMVLGLVNQRICVDSVPGMDCGGHFATVILGAAGVSHVYFDVSGQTFGVGYHKMPGSTLPCPTPQGTDHCEVVGSVSINNLLAMFSDADGDHHSNQAELTATPTRSNPLYNRSTPGDTGRGFPLDWDADNWLNEYEGTQSDVTRRCSTPTDPDGNGKPGGTWTVTSTPCKW